MDCVKKNRIFSVQVFPKQSSVGCFFAFFFKISRQIFYKFHAKYKAKLQ